MRRFVDAENHDAEEAQNEKLWELWLHRYQGKLGFGEWLETVKAKPAEREKPKEATKADMSRNLGIANETLAKLRKSTERR